MSIVRFHPSKLRPKKTVVEEKLMPTVAVDLFGTLEVLEHAAKNFEFSLSNLRKSGMEVYPPYYSAQAQVPISSLTQLEELGLIRRKDLNAEIVKQMLKLAPMIPLEFKSGCGKSTARYSKCAPPWKYEDLNCQEVCYKNCSKWLRQLINVKPTRVQFKHQPSGIVVEMPVKQIGFYIENLPVDYKKGTYNPKKRVLQINANGENWRVIDRVNAVPDYNISNDTILRSLCDMIRDRNTTYDQKHPVQTSISYNIMIDLPESFAHQMSSIGGWGKVQVLFPELLAKVNKTSPGGVTPEFSPDGIYFGGPDDWIMSERHMREGGPSTSIWKDIMAERENIWTWGFH